MADSWEPIRVYEVPSTAPDTTTTRQQIVSWLQATDLDRVESAGNAYVEAAKLIRDDGVQDAIMKAARDLTGVWRGDSATTALKALRLLFASAGALADAMHDTGRPMTEYAGEVRSTRDKVAGGNSIPGLPLGQYNNGANGGGGTAQSPYSPPVLDPNANSLSTTFTMNLRARQDMEDLNVKIDGLNRRLADGLSFQMPDISPIEVELEKQDKLDPGRGSDTPTGTTTYWNGNGSDGGTTGGTDGSSSTGNDSDTTTPGTTTPQDTTPADPEQGQDDPATDPQDDPATPDQPGDQDQSADQQDQSEQQQDVPPVIGSDNSQTQLADATTNPTTTTPGTSTNPYQSTVFPTQTPTTTPNPYTPGPGSSMWYGSGGSAPSAAPAVLRGGAATTGSGLMAYPPGMGMGMGAGAGNEGEERTREIYDPEPSLWSVSHDTSPDKIG